jgi:hypothetical protein
MGLKRRVDKIEIKLARTEAEYYAANFRELYAADAQATEVGKKMNKLIAESAAKVPYWYMPESGEELRRFMWLCKNNEEIREAWNFLWERLKKFVDSKISL